MKSGHKKVWLGLALVAAIVVTAAGVLWLSALRSPPQIITLPDGMRYRFAGVTWGTNHSQPRLAARVTDHLPAPIANYVRRKYGARLDLSGPYLPETPCLCVWLQRLGTNAIGGEASIIPASLADENGVEAGMFATVLGATSWSEAVFTVIPRRSRMLECHFYPGGSGNSGVGHEIGRIRFPNPLYGRYPQWQPEALPATKRAGGLEVQLTSCSCDFFTNGRARVYKMAGGSYAPGGIGYEAVTSFDLRIIPTPDSNETWKVEAFDFSDATGNRLSEELFPAFRGGTYFVRGAFWPDEVALRLKVYFERASGYPAEDLVTFTNVPLPGAYTTNGVLLTNLAAGMPVVWRNYRRDHNAPAFWPYQVGVALPTQPRDVEVDIVDITTDSGETLAHNDSRWSPDEEVWSIVTLPPNAKYLNVTVAVQKLRSVEFTVKPTRE